ncbi:MAG: V-type ATP synthase subunit E [Meiothermus sp.]|jgi:V/A-type H+-transporting ATPase subunit E|uniref:V-type ATP synthase subunit E n=1 Tax=Meiothermus sp. TaxID=1955249 RepID=UPI0028CF1837|nr:V-type ATP synthase subunit E [Meiothermus sp.]MDT7920671.1 V-type ATP synthase subunit E [Meiothermus sp.]
MSKLEDILQNEVAAEIGAIAAEAEARAKAIVDAAMAKAEALKANKQRQLEADHAAALRRAESAAELLLSQARITARGQAMERVRAEVGDSLQKLTQKPEFATILHQLADEALSNIGQAESVVVNPAHASLLNEWAQSKGLQLKTDPSIRDGVRLVAVGGRAFVQNTLSERLERAWDALSAKAAKAIWG